ncbi:MAG TPA: thiolase family protein [Candidatus Kapabacteria bacterium]|jgi:acetyl-CoA C-acetyltransferase|nr:thiolase family protein [Candidatus Kapabacteria bacterium]HPP40488.1 thiolase family protein [Candidatus Kapabacteria bacterium]HPU24209.1 thiolase family protein [Candidatus Kapabacteria bacterium]
MTSYILSAKRTPIGAFMGALSNFTAPQLGAEAIKAAVSQSNVRVQDIDEVIMGNVLTGGVGQAPARQAAIYANLPYSVECMTINKVCGSGLKSVMLAEQAIRCVDADLIVAGGQESMTNAPYFLQKARSGYKMGNSELVDMMIYDGLWDIYSQSYMGLLAEKCAEEHNITRQEQDEYAALSYKRALEAQANGYFADEIVPIKANLGKELITIDKDEEPEKVKFEKIPQLKPVFKKDGTITAANASSIDDGAAALVVASENYVRSNNLKPLAKIIAHASFSNEPEWFTTAPVSAIQKVLKKANLTINDIDLFEINEAFAIVPLYAMKALNIPIEKLNVCGGAVSLGHPIGASGARILTTLIYALHRQNKKLGVASLCIGGGEANAIIIEIV